MCCFSRYFSCATGLGLWWAWLFFCCSSCRHPWPSSTYWKKVQSLGKLPKSLLCQQENFPIAASPKEGLTVSLAVSVNFSGLWFEFFYSCICFTLLLFLIGHGQDFSIVPRQRLFGFFFFRLILKGIPCLGIWRCGLLLKSVHSCCVWLVIYSVNKSFWVSFCRWP